MGAHKAAFLVLHLNKKDKGQSRIPFVLILNEFLCMFVSNP